MRWAFRPWQALADDESLCVVSIDAWGETAAASPSWAEEHPGRAAWVFTLATYAGVALVAIGISSRLSQTGHGHAAPLWVVPLVLLGAAAFVVALPAALGFAAASCVTQRELTAGVVAGVVVTMLALAVAVAVAPAHLLG